MRFAALIAVGFRTLIAFRSENRAVFLTGFAKNERENIGPDELTYLRREASKILNWSDEQFNALLVSGAWTEIDFDE